MGRFSGVGSVSSNQGGLYFQQGNYTARLNEVKMITAQDGFDCFVIEAEVLESDNPERPKGCVPAQIIKIKPQYFATCMGNIKQFAETILKFEGDTPPAGEAEADVFWDEMLEMFVGEDNPLKGYVMELNCSNIQTKAGHDFTKHVWKRVISGPEGSKDVDF